MTPSLQREVLLSALLILALVVGLTMVFGPINGNDTDGRQSTDYGKDQSIHPSMNDDLTDIFDSLDVEYATADTPFETNVPLSGWYKLGKLLSSTEAYRLVVLSNDDLAIDQTDDICFVHVYSSTLGGIVSGSCVISTDSIATLSAQPRAGYEFIGWFDDDVFISSEEVFSVEVTENAIFEGRFKPIYDASFTVISSSLTTPTTLTLSSTYNLGVEQREWMVEDLITGEVLLDKTGSIGLDTVSLEMDHGRALSITHTMTYSDGKTSTFNIVEIVEEVTDKRFAWKYQEVTWYSALTNILKLNNRAAVMDITMTFSEYYEALTADVPRSGGYGEMDRYVLQNDPLIDRIAVSLQELTAGMSDIERVNCILKMVQSISYETDEDSKGVEDYWKLPAETLWEGNGDCEDHAFLFASIMEAMGYETVLHYIYCYNGNDIVAAHVAAGVNVSGGSGSHVTIDEVNYYYCEATAQAGTKWLNNANVGHMPSGYVIDQTFTLSRDMIHIEI